MMTGKKELTEGRREFIRNTIDELYHVDLRPDADLEKAVREHNHFISTKRYASWYLDTGTIFQVGQVFWICLSPACDLVPHQKANGQYKDVGPRMPFLAVKLHPLREDDPKPEANSSRHLFLQGKNGVDVYSYNFPASENAVPLWYPLYAENSGIVVNNKIKITRIKHDTKTGELSSSTEEASIIAQLRYEYALNLMHKLGGNLNRIGLDFASATEED